MKPATDETEYQYTVYFEPAEEGGFVVHHATGSHRVLKHPDRPELRVTVPFHNRDLKRGTLASIIRQAGLTASEFLDLL